MRNPKFKYYHSVVLVPIRQSEKVVVNQIQSKSKIPITKNISTQILTPPLIRAGLTDKIDLHRFLFKSVFIFTIYVNLCAVLNLI